MIGKILSAERIKRKLSQEEFAGIIGVSRQAIQKWESEKSFPDMENLLKIAGYLDLSLDYLVEGKDKRSVEQMRLDSRALPSYEKWDQWEAYYKSLLVEYAQCCDEGLDIEPYAALFRAVDAMPDSSEKDAMADILYRIIMKLPQKADYPYLEPNDLDTIRSQSDDYRPEGVGDDTIPFYERMLGAWYGRICGCLLGKPVECIKFDELTTFLKRSGNYPMYRYVVRKDLEGNLDGITYPFQMGGLADGNLPFMPSDDDTNYIVLAYILLENYGRDFVSENMMSIWLGSQIKNAYCTAERVAYRNFVNGYFPPQSAMYKNPFREWIGAQIRGDFFGWVNPGNPQLAAEMAWRDARMSHVKNGIYGEMWAAGMLAAAGEGRSIRECIRVGLSCIPKSSRLYSAVMNVMEFYQSGKPASDFFSDFHTRWNDYNNHHWCHTVSNAEIVTASLLYGEGDYGKSICLAVQQGFDTDCNGATVGSVLGMLLGADRIPEVWKEKVSGMLQTDIRGYECVNIREMAEKSLKIAESVKNRN